AVDALPQGPFMAATKLETTALTGSVTGSNVAETSVKGKAGQKLKVEVEAQRLGSKLRPVLHLYGSNKQQLTWAWTSPATFGDCRPTAPLPADADYTIPVHDVEYAAAAGSFFRLKIGEWDSVEGVFPPTVTQGMTKVELIGPSEPMQVEVQSDGAGQEPQP